MLNSFNRERAKKSNNILDAYFKAVTSHDINNIVAVFDPDAQLVTKDQVYRGRESIAEYYKQGILQLSKFYPEPGERYFSASGDSIAVEIKLHGNDTFYCVGDFFVFNDKHIITMHVYSGPTE